MTSASLLLVGAGAAAGAFVSGVSGFAYGLVALSLWSWQVEPALLAPMVVFGSLVAQILGLGSLRHILDWRSAWPLLMGGVIGVPMGIALVGSIDLPLFRCVVGLILLVYASTALLVTRRERRVGGGRLIEVALGVVSGILGGLAGLHGSLLALWSTLCGWSKERQRGIFQTYNSTIAVVALVLLIAAGKVGDQVLPLFAVILPATIVPAWLGVRLYHGLAGETFRRTVLGLLLCSGVAQLVLAFA